MLRTIITIVLPLVAPTILYMFWRFISWRIDKKLAKDEAGFWLRLPWFSLIFSGIFFMAISLVVTGLWSAPYERGRLYVAPFLQDGKVVPGHFEAPDF